MSSTQPRSDPPIRSRLPASEPELILCPPDLRLTEGQRRMLEMNLGIPDWAFEECTVDFLCEGTAILEPRTLKTWRTWLAKHVRAMWSNPDRRPKKPGPPASPDQLQAARRARTAELKAAVERTEQEFRAHIAECGPVPEEALAVLRAAGLRVGGVAAAPAPASGARPGTGSGEEAPESAPAGRVELAGGQA